MKHFDRLLFFIVIVIGIFGIVMIYSASAIWAEYKFQDPFKFVKSQSLFFILGIIMCLIVSRIPPDFGRNTRLKLSWLVLFF